MVPKGPPATNTGNRQMRGRGGGGGANPLWPKRQFVAQVAAPLTPCFSGGLSAPKAGSTATEAWAVAPRHNSAHLNRMGVPWACLRTAWARHGYRMGSAWALHGRRVGSAWTFIAGARTRFPVSGKRTPGATRCIRTAPFRTALKRACGEGSDVPAPQDIRAAGALRGPRVPRHLVPPQLCKPGAVLSSVRWVVRRPGKAGTVTRQR